MKDKTAILYIRVSTEEQAREGVSLEAQEKRLRDYAAMNNFQIVKLIREEGVSASKPLGDRPGGGELLKILSSGKVQNVITLKLDRLFRSALDGLGHATAWDKKDVALHFVDQGGSSINTRSAVGKLFFTVLAGMAEMERNLISERTSAALQHKKSQLQIYSVEPYGYTKNCTKLLRNRRELKVVETIKAWHVDGFSLREIAHKLNSAKIPTKKNKRWHASTISYLLKNSLYA